MVLQFQFAWIDMLWIRVPPFAEALPLSTYVSTRGARTTVRSFGSSRSVAATRRRPLVNDIVQKLVL